jgi:hypothetical protein
MEIFIYSFKITSGKGFSNINLGFCSMRNGNLAERFKDISVQTFFNFKIRV